jgi:hypothetical protein
LQEYAGGLHIVNVQKIVIGGTNMFDGLNGALGGAIYLMLDLNYKNIYGPIQYSFNGLTI